MTADLELFLFLSEKTSYVFSSRAAIELYCALIPLQKEVVRLTNYVSELKSQSKLTNFAN